MRCFYHRRRSRNTFRSALCTAEGCCVGWSILYRKTTGIAAAENEGQVSAEYRLTENEGKGRAADFSGLSLRLRNCMWDNASVIRCGESLAGAQKEIGEIKDILSESSPKSIKEMKAYYQLLSMCCTADILLASALLRKESRGAHFRSDSPDSSWEYLGNFICRKGPEGMDIYFKKKTEKD